MNLGAFEVLMRLATGDGVSQAVIGVTEPPSKPAGLARQVRQRSRERYGCAIADVEAEIDARRSAAEPAPKKKPRLGGMAWE
jgi:hypothetical protein